MKVGPSDYHDRLFARKADGLIHLIRVFDFAYTRTKRKYNGCVLNVKAPARGGRRDLISGLAGDVLWEALDIRPAADKNPIRASDIFRLRVKN